MLTPWLSPPDGKILAAASTGIVGKGAEDEARVLKLWDVESGRELAHLGEGHGQVAFFPDGKTLVSETPDSVTFWSLATCKPLRTIKCGSIDCLALSPNGRILAVGTYSAWVNLYDVASGDLRKKFHSGDRDVSALASSPDGKVLAVARYVRPLQLRDATTGKVKADLEDTQFPPSVAFSPDGKILAAGGADGKVKLWDLPVEK